MLGKKDWNDCTRCLHTVLPIPNDPSCSRRRLRTPSLPFISHLLSISGNTANVDRQSNYTECQPTEAQFLLLSDSKLTSYSFTDFRFRCILRTIGDFECLRTRPAATNMAASPGSSLTLVFKSFLCLRYFLHSARLKSMLLTLCRRAFLVRLTQSTIARAQPKLYIVRGMDLIGGSLAELLFALAQAQHS